MDVKERGGEEGTIITDSSFEKFCFKGKMGQELGSGSDFCCFLSVLFCGRAALFSDMMVLVQKDKLMYRRESADNY